MNLNLETYLMTNFEIAYLGTSKAWLESRREQ